MRRSPGGMWLPRRMWPAAILIPGASRGRVYPSSGSNVFFWAARTSATTHASTSAYSLAFAAPSAVDPPFAGVQITSASSPREVPQPKFQPAGSILGRGTGCRTQRNYRHYAEECERLAKTMPDESRRTLLEIAAAWRALAAEAERPAVRRAPLARTERLPSGTSSIEQREVSCRNLERHNQKEPRARGNQWALAKRGSRMPRRKKAPARRRGFRDADLMGQGRGQVRTQHQRRSNP